MFVVHNYVGKHVIDKIIELRKRKERSALIRFHGFRRICKIIQIVLTHVDIKKKKLAIIFLKKFLNI